ncbi:hypothetical protein NL676_008304 [Syzygium grande]|nr:hypothetical protein NL676_008304 [Syzygium grande]
MLQLHSARDTLEDARATGNGEEGVLVGNCWMEMCPARDTLDGDVPAVAEVEAVDGLVAIAALIRVVLDEDAETGDAEAALAISKVELVGEGDEVTEGVDTLLAQPLLRLLSECHDNESAALFWWFHNEKYGSTTALLPWLRKRRPLSRGPQWGGQR